MDCDCIEERSRGRTETRTVAVYKVPTVLPDGWHGLSSFVRVTRKTVMATGTTKENSYFISSLPPTTPAHVFQIGIRYHWRIESSLHYVKDVTFKEDASRIRTGQAPENMSLIRNIVLNLFRREPCSNIAQAIRLVAHDVPKMWKMIIA